MTLKIYTPDGQIFEGTNFPTLREKIHLSSLTETFSRLLSDLELRKRLVQFLNIEKQIEDPLDWYFQTKYTDKGLEILIFKRNQDWQLYAFGLPEKVLSLLSSVEQKAEILRLSGMWVRGGFETWLLGSLDSHKPLINLNPAHYQNKLYFEGLIGIQP